MNIPGRINKKLYEFYDSENCLPNAIFVNHIFHLQLRKTIGNHISPRSLKLPMIMGDGKSQIGGLKIYFYEGSEDFLLARIKDN